MPSGVAGYHGQAYRCMDVIYPMTTKCPVHDRQRIAVLQSLVASPDRLRLAGIVQGQEEPEYVTIISHWELVLKMAVESTQHLAGRNRQGEVRMT